MGGGRGRTWRGSRRGKEKMRAGTCGVREAFPLFVTLELGAEEKKNTMEAIKSKGGSGERADTEREAARSSGQLQSIAASLAAFGCRV